MSLSKIFDFKDRIKRDKDSDFISFERLMEPDQYVSENEPVDPLLPFREEREAMRRETQEMLVQAKAEKKRIEEQAYQKGYTKGEEEGLKTAKEIFDGKIKETAFLIASLVDQRALVFRQYEKELLILVKTMVERLAGHEISLNPLVIESCLQKSMKYVVEDSRVRVHLHGDDYEHIKKMSIEDPALLQGAQRIELIEDPAISRGGCLLKTDFGEIDASLENCKEKLFEIVDRAFLEAFAADGKE